jgi:voltage-gated potassium channel
MERRNRARIARFRRRVHDVLDSGASDRTSILIHRVLITLVIGSVSAVVLESVPALRQSWGPYFAAMEVLAAFIFTIEYGLRIWSVPEHTPYGSMSSWQSRWAYARTGSAIIDLLAIMPIYLDHFLPADLSDFRVLMLLRLLRFFKLARYSPGMRSLMAALEAERKALGASAVILMGLVLISASAMHLVEHNAQPDKFGSIPDAMWWAIVTLTTVGYGDVVPITLAGRVVASFTMVMGLMMLALPIGIVATAFAEEIHRREFVVTWAMVARVPLFSALDASEIAEIMQYLRAQTVPTNTLIVRRGEAAQSMYFIAAGEVVIEHPNGPVHMGEGQFFGEIAVLRKTRRTATVRAVQPTKLLVLDSGDLHTLMERNPEVGRRIETAVLERGELSNQQGGDMTASEVTTPPPARPDRD